MEEFKSYKLSEVANLSTGFPFDGSKYSKSGIRVVRGDNVTIGSLRWDSEKLKCWSEPFSRAKEYSLQDGDIVIGMDGSRVGRNRAQISESDLPLLLAQRVACIRHNEKSVQDYLYYLIFNERFVDYVKSVQTGTSIPHISLKQIGDYEVQLPSIERQKSICRVLKSLDEKIALNNRINHNLEEQAQALYKSWFVDFEPFKDGEFVDSELGMIPEGWRAGTIYDICDVYYGAPFNSTLFNAEKKGLPLIRIRDLGKQEARVFTEERHPKGQLTCKGDILVSMDGEFSIYIWGGEDSWINQRITRFSPKPGISHYFLTETLRLQLKAVESSEVATTVIHIGKNDYDKFWAIIPPQSVLDSFYNVSEPLYLQYVENLSGNQELSSSRDVLLPRLMSGEISFTC